MFVLASVLTNGNDNDNGTDKKKDKKKIVSFSLLVSLPLVGILSTMVHVLPYLVLVVFWSFVLALLSFMFLSVPLLFVKMVMVASIWTMTRKIAWTPARTTPRGSMLLLVR